jgi:hypothetical protein
VRTLTEHIRQKNPGGLSYEEGVQLFLWMYCSLDVVPDSFRSEVVSKESLVRIFQELAQSGFIRAPADAGGSVVLSEIAWPEMVNALLSQRVQLDQDFRARIDQFL